MQLSATQREALAAFADSTDWLGRVYHATGAAAVVNTRIKAVRVRETTLLALRDKGLVQVVSSSVERGENFYTKRMHTVRETFWALTDAGRALARELETT